MDGNMMDWMMGSWWLFGWILTITLIAGVILAIVWTVRQTSRPTAPTETPLDILKRRLARGEITPDQFETIKRQLDES